VLNGAYRSRQFKCLDRSPQPIYRDLSATLAALPNRSRAFLMGAQLTPIHRTKCSIGLSKLKPKEVNSYSTLGGNFREDLTRQKAVPLQVTKRGEHALRNAIDQSLKL